MVAKGCEHTAWIQLVHGKAQQKLICDDRLHLLASRLKDPERQTPSVTVFLGQKAKDECLRQIFPQNNIKKSRKSDAVLSIRCDSSSLGSPDPLYFADVDPSFSSCGLELGKNHCHSQEAYPIEWTDQSQGRFLDLVLARLIFLFSDAVCLFAADCGGVTGLLGLLSRWITLGNDSHRPAAIRPRLLLITDEDDESFTAPLIADEIRKGLHDTTPLFASIQVVRVAKESSSCSSPYLNVRTELLKALRRARNDRDTNKMLFSALHQEALFKAAVSHFSATIREPFNFVKAARHGLDLSPELSQHVLSVFNMAQSRVSEQVILSILASSTLMDARPPGMHEFRPEVLFRMLYKDDFSHAFSNISPSPGGAEQLCEKLQREFERLWTASTNTRQTHLDVLKRSATQWAPLKSNTTCLCCARRKPEYVMPCTHAPCERCFKTFARNVSGDRDGGIADMWSLSDCPNCNMQISFKVRIKPRTAGYRLIGIDGGGIKGTIPLENLFLLQNMIGDCPIQELFDLAFGTSVGGLIVLNLFLQHNTVERSSSIFKNLSESLFQKADGFFDRLRKYCIQNSLYDSDLLQQVLIQQFGPLARMFDYHEALLSRSGTKVAVVACSTKDSTARVFATYNGQGIRNHTDLGYKIEHPANPHQEPHVWQAARATSAAPGLFKKIHIPYLGGYLDGALIHNNPIKIAKWESRYIWPNISKPDVVLSLGTGHRAVTLSPETTTPKISWKDVVPIQAFDALMFSMDGQNEWREMVNSLTEDELQDYFRLTVEFSGAEPRLDDVSSMEKLAKLVRSDPQGLEYRSKVLTTLLISCFYLELDEKPCFDGGGLYLCQGKIRCRSSAAVRSLLSICEDGLEYFIGARSLSALVSIQDLCQECGRYCRPVKFFVRSLSDQICLSIKWGHGNERRLSAMPQAVSWFVRMQELDSPFGISTHLSGRATCPLCDVQKEVTSVRNRKRRMPDRGGEDHFQQGLRAKKLPRVR